MRSTPNANFGLLSSAAADEPQTRVEARAWPSASTESPRLVACGAEIDGKLGMAAQREIEVEHHLVLAYLRSQIRELVAKGRDQFAVLVGVVSAAKYAATGS